MEKKLYRVEEGKMLGGVCTGIAQYFSLDPTVVRLIWVLCSLMGGSGLLAYILCLLIMPEEPAGY